MVLRVLFWGNSQSVFSNRHFQALLEAPCQLVGVVDSPSQRRGSTNPLPEGVNNFRDSAKLGGIPAFEPKYPNQLDFVSEVKTLSPDLFLAVGYVNILKEAILNVPNILAVNFHASLLPAYRGMHPLFWCLRNGERWAGLSVHVMDIGIDTGDIIYQVRLRTRKGDSVNSLYDRIMLKSIKLVPRLVIDVARGQVQRVKQPAEGSSYYSSINREDYRVKWELEAKTIQRWIYTTPGKCFIEFNHQFIHLLDGLVNEVKKNEIPGRILKIGKKKVSIATGKGSLWIGNVIFNGMKNMVSVCNELRLREGDLINNG